MIKELLHLTEKSGDTLILDNFVAKVFYMMLRRSLEPVNFSLLNRAYVPDHVLFKAMFARECASWKEFQDLVARSYPGKHQKNPFFLGAGKLRMVLTQHDLDADESGRSYLLTIAKHEVSQTHYPDLPEYVAASSDAQRIVLLPPVHDPEMDSARVSIQLTGDGTKRLWYFISCAQATRRSELAIFQRVLGPDREVIAEKKTVLHVGEKILLSSLDLPEGESVESFTFEFFVKCLSGFPAWASDVTISNFYGEGS